MSNYDQIGTLYDKAEKLTGVRDSVFNAGLDGSDWIAAVEMRFESTVASVYVEPKCDTLRVELTEVKVGADCYVRVASSIQPWEAWWTYQNHGCGYSEIRKDTRMG